MQVAAIILEQLGGKVFKMFTGSKDFVGGDNYLSFKVGKNPKKVSHVRITLDPSDTYTVEFMKWNSRKLEMNVVEKSEMVYNDQLKAIFTEYTGLYTSFNG